MKKQLFMGMVLIISTILPCNLLAQSTEGTDFWVTLMRGDEGNYDELSLTFAAKDSTKVYIENTYTGYKDTVKVGNDTIARLPLNDNVASCYVTDMDEEIASNHALHITSDKNIICLIIVLIVS